MGAVPMCRPVLFGTKPSIFRFFLRHIWGPQKCSKACEAFCVQHLALCNPKPLDDALWVGWLYVSGVTGINHKSRTTPADWRGVHVGVWQL